MFLITYVHCICYIRLFLYVSHISQMTAVRRAKRSNILFPCIHAVVEALHHIHQYILLMTISTHTSHFSHNTDDDIRLYYDNKYTKHVQSSDIYYTEASGASVSRWILEARFGSRITGIRIDFT